MYASAYSHAHTHVYTHTNTPVAENSMKRLKSVRNHTHLTHILWHTFSCNSILIHWSCTPFTNTNSKRQIFRFKNLLVNWLWVGGVKHSF